jgi:hypothetical protein
VTTQQSLGRAAASTAGSKTRTSYINHENTLSAFDFPATHVATEAFEPVLSAAQSKGESWLGLNFFSKFDGVQGAAALRPLVRLRLAVALDVSGSMASSFDNDMSYSSWGQFRASNNENAKLEVAKQCLLAVARQLEPGDELGVVLFNHTHEVLVPLTTVGAKPAQFRTALAKKLQDVCAGGGTDLAEGFQAALDLFGQQPANSRTTRTPRTAGKGKGRKKSATAATAAVTAASSSASEGDSQVTVSRVLFLTDMQSDQHDEDAVLALASAAAADSTTKRNRNAEAKSTGPIYTSITGIGVDLSVGAVRALSQTPGGRYGSVASAAEFSRVAGSDTMLVHEAVPVAFDITATVVGIDHAVAPPRPPLSSSTSFLPPPPPSSSGSATVEAVRLEAGCGHPEAAAVKPGDTQVTFSSEFAASEKGEPPILLRLSGCDQARGPSGCAVKFTWRNFDGSPGAATLTVPPGLGAEIPALLPSPPSPLVSSSALSVPSSISNTGTGNGSNSNNESAFTNLNIRKALALVRFVDFQESYMTQDNNDVAGAEDDDDYVSIHGSLGARMAPPRRSNMGRSYQWSAPPVQSQQQWPSTRKRKAGAPGTQGAIHEAEADLIEANRLVDRALVAEDWSNRAASARATLLAEVGEVCADASVVPGGNNQAFAETLQQIVDLELADANCLRARAASLGGSDFLGNDSTKNTVRSSDAGSNANKKAISSESGMATRRNSPRKCNGK